MGDQYFENLYSKNKLQSCKKSMKKSLKFKDLTKEQKRIIVQNLSFLPHYKKPYFPPIKFQEQEDISRELSNLFRKMKSFSQKYEGRASLIIRQCVKSLQVEVDSKKSQQQSLHRSYEQYHRQILSLNSSFSQVDDSTLQTQLSKTRKPDLRKIESRKLIERQRPNNTNSASIQQYKNEIISLKQTIESKNKLIDNYNSEMAILKTRLQEIEIKLQHSNQKLLFACAQSCSLANINQDLINQIQNLKKNQEENRINNYVQMKASERKIIELESYLKIRQQQILTLWQAQISHPLYVS